LAAGPGNPMPRLTLYTKPDCSLCDAAAAALARVRERVAFDLEVVDISPDPELRAGYGERIPVVLVDGELVFEYEVDEQALEHRLSATGALS
jgi:glutaredoxin